METNFNPIRYSTITDNFPREIVMLRGSGCKWKKCIFCDYHTDSSKNEEENYLINAEALSHVTGEFHVLEAINSGSFLELDEKTIDLIEQICIEKQITELHFESHWMYKNQIAPYRERFYKNGINLKVRIGVETFDYIYRENVLQKGMPEDEPKEIAAYFDEINLLFGLKGQTLQSMKEDIETGLKYFERVIINLMIENTTPVKPDPDVVATFMTYLYPSYKKEKRVDILINNTDFGVGGEQHE